MISNLLVSVGSWQPYKCFLGFFECARWMFICWHEMETKDYILCMYTGVQSYHLKKHNFILFLYCIWSLLKIYLCCHMLQPKHWPISDILLHLNNPHTLLAANLEKEIGRHQTTKWTFCNKCWTDWINKNITFQSIFWG